MTWHHWKDLRRQSHQHGTGNCLPFDSVKRAFIQFIQQVWTRHWGLFRKNASQMFQAQPLPQVNMSTQALLMEEHF